MPKDFLQNMAGKIQESLPEGLKNTHAEIDRVVKEQLENVLPNFKFAKQDEFEIQQKILLKTRSEVDDLKARIIELEAVIRTLQTQKED
ncbi:accessory factor UbiK family protein [Wohlfahrtiimonas larvae]|uniref:Ubiquinone biosynthesis accessory factor UbiK n=1 Tax=Wohlfahrtiimonas larvae TaxID=1157986 RepID=A0ABP9MEX4_9GAMM|nr:accessory factor UbiK family protein [Wohlfahrtiimonas larvae]